MIMMCIQYYGILRTLEYNLMLHHTNLNILLYIYQFEYNLIDRTPISLQMSLFDLPSCNCLTCKILMDIYCWCTYTYTLVKT